MLWSLTGEGGKVSRVVIGASHERRHDGMTRHGNCTFFIRNHFIRSLLQDSLKVKKPLELHEKS